MKLEEIIAGYVDLARQAVAYRKATESYEERQNSSWRGLACAGSEVISAYIAESDESVAAACIADVEVAFYSGKIYLPFEPEKREGLEDKLVSARKKMLEIVLMQSLDAEGSEA